MIAICIFVVGAIGYGIVRFVQLSQEVVRLRSSPNAAQEIAKAEVANLVEEVKKLISVPSDEMPTVATVSDSEKLKNNAFFANAMNGDKVLIFTTTKKAILYRPSENKIIEVGPISIGTSSASQTEQTTFVLYNGTDVTGLTKTYEAQLKGLIPGTKVVDRDNAARRDYTTSLLIDLTGTHAASVYELGKMLGIEVGMLPEGEVKPTDAEYLIILGSDKK